MFRLKAALNDIQRSVALRNIWFFQAYETMASKYRRTILGPFWIAASMVVTSLSLSLVFGAVFGQPLRTIIPYITSGLIAWGIVSAPMIEGPEVFMSAAATIKNHNFPFMYYVFESIFRNMILALHNFAVFIVLVVLINSFSGINWTLILSVPLVYASCLFYSAMVGMVAARYRDIRFLFPYIAQLIFFMTPIFWKPGNIGGSRLRQTLLGLNPLSYLVDLIRRPLLGQAPSYADWVAGIGILAIGFIAWLTFFSLFRRRIPFWV